MAHLFGIGAETDILRVATSAAELQKGRDEECGGVRCSEALHGEKRAGAGAEHPEEAGSGGGEGGEADRGAGAGGVGAGEEEE